MVFIADENVRSRVRVLLVMLWIIAVVCGARVVAVTVLRSAPDSLREGIDPNIAPWWELTLLPGIGPVTAQAIVAFRDEREPPAFRTTFDLTQVRGIGPRTVQQLGPFLRFGEPTPASENRGMQGNEGHP